MAECLTACVVLTPVGEGNPGDDVGLLLLEVFRVATNADWRLKSVSRDQNTGDRQDAARRLLGPMWVLRETKKRGRRLRRLREPSESSPALRGK